MINWVYEVFFDFVERIWYDLYWERIFNVFLLLNFVNVVFGEFDLNLWLYFFLFVFLGFGEIGNGFYFVYSEVFKKVYM